MTESSRFPLAEPARSPSERPAYNGKKVHEKALETPAAPTHAHEDHIAPMQPASWLGMGAVVGTLAVLLGGLFVIGLLPKINRGHELTHAAKPGRPRVTTAVVEEASREFERTLPGAASAFQVTAVYARTNGYLKARYADIGDHVQEGQLLAEIETPEIDAQRAQAVAALAESKATLARNKATAALARVTLTRDEKLLANKAVSQQTYDDDAAAVTVAEANVTLAEATIEANEANVRRLEQLQSYQKVLAPFSGVVTQRNFDVGGLIVADNPAANRELFTLVQPDVLRVFVDVPQTFAVGIKPGQKAVVFRREHASQKFQGTVARTSGAIDPATRTLRVEIHVPNQEEKLLPGMYLQATISLDAETPSYRIPSAALITRADGQKVAIVDEAGAVRYRMVQVGRDFGATVEVQSGLSAGDRLLVRPGDDMPEGTLVEPIPAAKS